MAHRGVGRNGRCQRGVAGWCVVIVGPEALKKLLLERRQLFLRHLTEKMLAYALGRGVEYYDIPAVKQITETVAAEVIERPG